MDDMHVMLYFLGASPNTTSETTVAKHDQFRLTRGADPSLRDKRQDSLKTAAIPLGGR